MNFNTFDLNDEIFAGLRDLQYEQPTDIQQKCIPLILQGEDVLGSAQTGTGKTGAFVIPLLQKIITSKKEGTQALILAPTRELASQIDEQIVAVGYHTGITSAIVIGGSDFAAQAKAIRAGVDIIVATPGRLLDQINILNIDFSHINYLVLDEGDRMLDMGFLPDVSKIIAQLPTERQTLLFSATLPDELKKVVNRVMKNPKTVAIAPSKPVDSVDQQVYFVSQNQKTKLVERLFETLDWETALIFTATKRGTDELERRLKKRGINAISMHGDRSQQERNEALRAFKNKQHSVMVATDVLSRGIDIDDISLIVNYDVPRSPEDYIHRIGRTGRYDKTGTAVTLVEPKTKKYYQAIKKVVGSQLHEKKGPAAEKKQQHESENRPSSRRIAKPGNQKRPLKNPAARNPTSSAKYSSKQKTNKPQSMKKNTSAVSDKSSGSLDDAQQANSNHGFRPDVIEKAVKRNKHARKPSTGFWGVVKSCIPKFKAK